MDSVCLNCTNSQPVIQTCLLCDIQTSYNCVGKDCWDIPKKDGKVIPLWLCFICSEATRGTRRREETTEDKKCIVQLVPDEETASDAAAVKNTYKWIRGKYMGKDNYVTLQCLRYVKGEVKTCPKCENAQPVLRKCSSCNCENYLSCVGSDCWKLRPESPGKNYFLCSACKCRRRGELERAGEGGDKNHQVAASSKSDGLCEDFKHHRFEMFCKETLDEAKGILKDATNNKEVPRRTAHEDRAATSQVTVWGCWDRKESQKYVRAETKGIYETLHTIMKTRVQDGIAKGDIHLGFYDL